MLIELERPTSFSRLSGFKECQRRYFWQYVQPLPVDQATVDRKYGFGRFFHDRVEAGFAAMSAHMNQQRVANPLLPPIPDVQQFVHAAYRGGVSGDDQKKWATMMGHFANWLFANQQWLSVMFAQDNPIVEMPFALNTDWEFVPWDGDRRNRVPDLALRGFIDLLVLVRGHSMAAAGRTVHTPMIAYIWDWKTSTIRSKPYDPKTNQPSPQLALYAFALFRRYPQLERVVATYFNVRWKQPEQPITFTREQAEHWGPAWVESIVDELMELDPYNQECWEPKKNEWCYTCEFSGVCPLMKRYRYELAKQAEEAALLEAGA